MLCLRSIVGMRCFLHPIPGDFKSANMLIVLAGDLSGLDERGPTYKSAIVQIFALDSAITVY